MLHHSTYIYIYISAAARAGGAKPKPAPAAGARAAGVAYHQQSDTIVDVNIEHISERNHAHMSAVVSEFVYVISEVVYAMCVLSEPARLHLFDLF